MELAVDCLQLDLHTNSNCDSQKFHFLGDKNVRIRHH